MKETYLDTKEKISADITMGKTIYLFNSPENRIFAIYNPALWIK
jgi:hypothetical protein